MMGASWAPKLGVDLAGRPRLGAFSGRVVARKAAQAAMAAEGLPTAA